MATETNHPFERARLGRPPFRFLGMETRIGPIKEYDANGQPTGLEIGAPGQPMGTCDYCGQGIANCYSLQGSGPDDKPFIVGCDCVMKSSKSYGQKDDPATKAIKKAIREATKARESERIAKAQTALETDERLRSHLASKPHPNKWWADQGRTLLSNFEWMLTELVDPSHPAVSVKGHGGHSGKIKATRKLEKLLKKL